MLITVPLPPRGCSSNGDKGSWRKKAAATKVYRQEGIIATRNAPLPPAGVLRMSLVFCTKGVRASGRYAPRDISNGVAAFKGCQDGLCEGWGVKDDHKHLQLGSVSIDNRRGPYVLVTIEAVGEPTTEADEASHKLGAADVRTSTTIVGT